MQQELTAEQFGLEPAYKLTYRGIAADADLDKLNPLFCRLLQLAPEQAATVLKSPPLHLAFRPDRERLRALQLGLAKLGCISSIETAWRYRDWTLDEELLHRLEPTPSRPQQDVAFALIRIHPAPGFARLARLIRQFQDGDSHILNSAEILIERNSQIDTGVGHWLRDIHRRVEKQIKGENIEVRLESAFALVPEDGNQAQDILKILEKRAKHPPIDQSGASIAQLAARPIAGRAWHTLLAQGRENLQHSELPEAVRQTILDQWPLQDKLTEAVDPAEASADLARLIRRFARDQQHRDDHRDTLLQEFIELDRLPSLPAVAMKAYQMAQSADVDAEELSRTVEQDPSLSTRLLTVVNSPYFGLRARVDSITHALVILGREELAHLALLLSSEAVFRGLSNAAGQALWQHSARTAELARALARMSRRFEPSSSYTAALLHDVGKIFLLSFAPRQLRKIEQLGERYGLPDYEFEREWFAHDHATLGAAMLRRWGLPANLCEAVEQHHGPLPGQPGPTPEAALVALADHIAHRLEQSNGWADGTRLRRCQLRALQPDFGVLDMATIDLLAEELRPQIKQLNQPLLS